MAPKLGGRPTHTYYKLSLVTAPFLYSRRLECIVHQDVKLYLVFEFMKMDLKKYIDREEVHPMLVKVRFCLSALL